MVAIVLLVVWFAAVLMWALQPVDDSVPTGIVNNQQTSQTVHCDSPVSGNDGPRGPIPSPPEGRAYERTPCTQVHAQYRTLFWIDSALAFVALALLFAVRRRPADTPDAAAVVVSSHSASTV